LSTKTDEETQRENNEIIDRTNIGLASEKQRIFEQPNLILHKIKINPGGKWKITKLSQHTRNHHTKSKRNEQNLCK
jgi:hypothetical protein